MAVQPLVAPGLPGWFALPSPFQRFSALMQPKHAKHAPRRCPACPAPRHRALTCPRAGTGGRRSLGVGWGRAQGQGRQRGWEAGGRGRPAVRFGCRALDALPPSPYITVASGWWCTLSGWLSREFMSPMIWRAGGAASTSAACVAAQVRQCSRHIGQAARPRGPASPTRRRSRRRGAQRP